MMYFAYASNMDRKQMAQRCPNAKLIGKALLQGYRLVFDRWSDSWGCGVADIVKDDSSQVWGLLYEVSDRNLASLEHYEGDPTFYRRAEVTVIDEYGKRRKVVTYEVVDKESFVGPSSKYLNILKQISKTYDFPKDYQDTFASFEKKAVARAKGKVT